jgi:hypothetical protein
LGEPDRATVTIKDLPVDDWRNSSFSEDPNGENANDSADAEGDGISNLMEYALFLDPNVSDNIYLPSITIVLDDLGDKHMVLTYKRAVDANDLIYTVEVSNNLEDWRSNEDGIGDDVTLELSRFDNGDGTETVEVYYLFSAMKDSERFIRLKVSRLEI